MQGMWGGTVEMEWTRSYKICAYHGGGIFLEPSVPSPGTGSLVSLRTINVRVKFPLVGTSIRGGPRGRRKNTLANVLRENTFSSYNPSTLAGKGGGIGSSRSWLKDLKTPFNSVRGKETGNSRPLNRRGETFSTQGIRRRHSRADELM